MLTAANRLPAVLAGGAAMVLAACGVQAGAVEASGDDLPAPLATASCVEPSAGYVVRYPASWFTVTDGPVPCRFFSPQPFRLDAATEAPDVAVIVELAPVPFEAVVPPPPGASTNRVTVRMRARVAGRDALRVESTTSGYALVPEQLRQVTWYVDVGGSTLLGTTSEAAAGGTFADNVRVLDEIMSALAIPSSVSGEASARQPPAVRPQRPEAGRVAAT